MPAAPRSLQAPPGFAATESPPAWPTLFKCQDESKVLRRAGGKLRAAARGANELVKRFVFFRPWSPAPIQEAGYERLGWGFRAAAMENHWGWLCFSSALDLKEHLQKRVKKLGAGIKRKLCFALSMLGNPHVTLLDEPSAGMDPIAIQQMWRAIRAAFKSKQRAAILTTHYMAEAEAVCDRVAILVSGKLRCIGTVQHLKTKFGRGYFLEMKLKEVPNILQKERLQRRILRIFPNASCQKSFASILAYRIPKEDVQSLALSFSKLEEAKHAFNIEEYNFSQATLEQVFMELVREQEEEDNNFGTLNGTVSWERSQGERVIF